MYKARDLVRTMYQIVIDIPGSNLQFPINLGMDEEQQELYDLVNHPQNGLQKG